MRRARIDPGALRTRLTLEVAETVVDATGGHVENWNAVATLFARLEPVAASSRFGPDQRIERVTHHITIRHRDDVASGMRFRAGARLFAIRHLHDPDESGRYLVCQSEEEGR
ncbi:phage head closure protein [Nitratireductor sp. CAU 1489]|uniref:Phage head closure protein n=1 Tax=Nitratireductor arenosus TaxID=2682096 RepID=A0A844QPI8_9HYPH|nr:phage head closure protein [Nitratireductor arenosus]